MMLRRDKLLIDKIEKVRKANNRNWVMLLRLCFELAAPRARAILRDISVCDKEIVRLSKALAK